MHDDELVQTPIVKAAIPIQGHKTFSAQVELKTLLSISSRLPAPFKDSTDTMPPTPRAVFLADVLIRAGIYPVVLILANRKDSAV